MHLGAPALIGLGALAVSPVEAATLAGLVVVAALQVLVMVRVSGVRRGFRRLARGTTDENLEQLLGRLLDRTDGVGQQLAQLRRDHDELAAINRRAIQRVGMVRFNAYADTGGDQSFALALTDEEGNGTILNGLFHRSECRVYAKPVTGWRSNYALTDEEEEALRKARAG
ncbi:MAG: DUF4446 family protein [Candidatus Dormibacteria bacterium]